MLHETRSIILTTLLFHFTPTAAAPMRLRAPALPGFISRLSFTNAASTSFGSASTEPSRLATLQRVGNYTTGPTAAPSSASVTVCTGVGFTGSCDTVDWPMDECIDLNDYAGKTLSFRPVVGAECYLMQGRCNSDLPYADLLNNSTLDSDLSGLPWISKTQSYLCMEPIVLK